MIKRGPLLLATLLSFAPGAQAADYHSLIDALEPYSNLAAFPYLHGNATIGSMSGGVKPSDIEMTIHARAGDIVVRSGQDGMVDIPVDAGLRAENPSVDFNQPKGSVAISPALKVSAPPRTQISYQLYWDMAGQYQEWQSQRLGLIQRFHAAKPTAMVIAFSTDASAIVELPAGPVTLTTDTEHKIRIVQKDEWRKIAPQIRFSAMPDKISLESD